MDRATPPMSDPDTVEDRQELVINASYETFTFVLVVLQFVNGLLWLVLPHEQARVVYMMAIFVGAFLMGDALLRFKRAPNMRQFLIRRHGWMIIVGSIPVPFISLLRVLWYWLTVRSLRRDDYSTIGRVVTTQRARSALLLTLLMVILVLEAGGVLILRAESGHSTANIRTASDAIWWILVTIATVGYGDTFPVSPKGRVVGVAVLIVGVGLFSVLTSFLAQWFLRPRLAAAQRTEMSDPREYVTPIDKLDALAAMLDRNSTMQQADLAELRAKLEEIDARLNQKEGVPGS